MAREYYHVGNTARKYDTSIKEQPVREEKPRQEVYGEVQPHTLTYTVYLVIAGVISLLMCVAVLYTQSIVSKQYKKIDAMQVSIENLRDENIAYETRLNNSVDLEAIRQQALERGMIYPDENNVIYYEQANLDQTKQYMDVPDVK